MRLSVGAIGQASWTLKSILCAPSRTLDAWSVFEVFHDGSRPTWTRHLVGWKREGCVGQVSASVTEFDPVLRRARTRSGRVYELAGRSGLNADAMAVWARWKYSNGVLAERDVTDEVERLMFRDSGPV